MKIKFNWGTGIFVFILIFFASMGVRIYISYQQEQSLVESDYYPKGINYQQQIDKAHNAAELQEKPTIRISNDSIKICFPDFFKNKKLSGNILIYRPSDENKDVNLTLQLQQNLCQNYSIKQLSHGKYLIKLDWKDEDKSYYMEKEIFVFEKIESTE